MNAAGSPTFDGNIVRGNMAREGGAFSMGNRSEANFVNNLVVENTASSEGGGFHWLVPAGTRGPW